MLLEDSGGSLPIIQKKKAVAGCGDAGPAKLGKERHIQTVELPGAWENSPHGCQIWGPSAITGRISRDATAFGLPLLLTSDPSTRLLLVTQRKSVLLQQIRLWYSWYFIVWSTWVPFLGK